MTTLEIVAIIVVPLLVVLAGFFGIAETVLTRMTRSRAESLADPSEDSDDEDEADADGPRGSAEVMHQLVSDRVPSLAPVWLLSLVCILGVATIISLIAWQRWGGPGVAVAFVLELILLFGLVVLGPRSRALTSLDSVSMAVAPVVGWIVRSPLSLVIRPLVRLAGRATEGADESFEPTLVSEAELLALTEQAVEDDVIEPEEQALIESVIEFGDTRVASVMVPRPDMVTLPVDATVDDALAAVVEHGYSRFPVVGEGIDDIVGICHAKDLIRANLDGKGQSLVPDHARKVSTRFVPEVKHVAKLQREMQAETFHMAIVVDEYGGTAGLVTLEDLLEELVGEIVDEFDVEEPMIEQLSDGARVNGKVSLSDLEELVGERLPAGDWSTVGGLIFGTLGHVPGEGEELELEHHRLVVERVQGARIARVRLSRLQDQLQ